MGLSPLGDKPLIFSQFSNVKLLRKQGMNCNSNNRNRSKLDFLYFPQKMAINAEKGVAFDDKPMILSKEETDSFLCFSYSVFKV
jgi:hypothetical protein